MARPTAADLAAIELQYEWSTNELGAMLGRSGRWVRSNLVDQDGKPIEVGDIPSDGRAWVRIRQGVLIEGRRNHNGFLRFFRRDVRAALEPAS
jgi:hypothetical protein